MSEYDIDALAAELEEFTPSEKHGGRTPIEARVISGFEEIQRFVDQNGRLPGHGEEHDLFERLYTVRLDRIRALAEVHHLLVPLDRQSLLCESFDAGLLSEKILEIDELAAELSDIASTSNITTLRHVRSNAEKRAADEIANRKPCQDFETYRPLFERVLREVNTGLRKSEPIVAGRRDVMVGDVFVLDGLTLYIAEVGEPLKTTGGEVDRRLRVIFSNATESNLLLRSLQRAFYDDPAARRLTSPGRTQLHFSDTIEEGDLETGTIYVLRSCSDHPYVAQHRDSIHKVGVTSGSVERRIANAENEATYLLAKVEVVATYTLAGINRIKMEHVFHRLFAPARLDITIKDRFGYPVRPREWFLVPLFVINEAVERIRDGSITEYVYDHHAARLVRAQKE